MKINSKWKEIRNNNFNNEEFCITIDAWKTNSDSEEGKVIARVYRDRTVWYLDPIARTDKYAQKVITEARKRMSKVIQEIIKKEMVQFT